MFGKEMNDSTCAYGFCVCVCVLLRLNKAIDSVNAHIDVTQAATLVLTHDV